MEDPVVYVTVILEMSLKELGGRVCGWVNLAEGWDQWWAVVTL